MAVHGFPGSVRQRPRSGVPQAGHHLCPPGFQRSQQELVLAVEIRGTGKDTSRLQSPQRVPQQSVPNDRFVPIILVADEHEIKGRQLFHPVRGRSVACPELNFTTGEGPSGCRLRDRIRPQVNPEIKPDRGRSKSCSESTGFIRPPAGEVQNCQPIGREIARDLQSITHKARQSGHVPIGPRIAEWPALDHGGRFGSHR